MIFSAACWLVVIWFMDPAYEARHPGVFRRCAWVAIVLCCVFACTHYVYRFTTSFQLLFGALPSRGSTRQKPQSRGWPPLGLPRSPPHGSSPEGGGPHRVGSGCGPPRPSGACGRQCC
jgi:hypothetical protein